MDINEDKDDLVVVLTSEKALKRRNRQRARQHARRRRTRRGTYERENAQPELAFRERVPRCQFGERMIRNL